MWSLMVALSILEFLFVRFPMFDGFLSLLDFVKTLRFSRWYIFIHVTIIYKNIDVYLSSCPSSEQYLFLIHEGSSKHHSCDQGVDSRRSGVLIDHNMVSLWLHDDEKRATCEMLNRRERGLKLHPGFKAASFI